LGACGLSLLLESLALTCEPRLFAELLLGSRVRGSGTTFGGFQGTGIRVAVPERRELL
jgi:hypothetical protein